MRESTKELLGAIKDYYNTEDVVYGKGGFFVRGKGFISISKARLLTKKEAPERQYRGRMSSYGDYATVEMFNRRTRK